jgi:hypothetical protein
MKNSGGVEEIQKETRYNLTASKSLSRQRPRRSGTCLRKKSMIEYNQQLIDKGNRYANVFVVRL